MINNAYNINIFRTACILLLIIVLHSVPAYSATPMPLPETNMSGVPTTIGSMVIYNNKYYSLFNYIHSNTGGCTYICQPADANRKVFNNYPLTGWITVLQYYNFGPMDSWTYQPALPPPPACSLSISSLSGNNTILNPASGGSISFGGNITESSGQPISWTLKVLDRTFTGNGSSVSATWDGKLSDGTVVKPGSYSATLTAQTADGKCTENRTVNFTVIPAPEGQCGLYVQFGSSAHVANGNLNHSQTLFAARGGVLPAEMTLYYNSLDPINSTLGRGWSHNYNYSLKENSDGSVLISEPDWKYRYYLPSGAGYSTQPGNYAVLAKDANGFTLTHRDGTSYRYTTGGAITSITDRNGNSQTFSYNNGLLTGVTDPSGRVSTFSYDGSNRITAITDPTGNSYTLNVGTSLTTVTQPDNSAWQFSYGNNGFMLGKVDPLGNSTSYSYDDQHRVNGSTDPEGKTRSISYPQTNEAVKSTTFTEKDGNSWSYSYDSQKGQLLSRTDPQSGTISYTYDTNGNRTSTINPDGTSTSAIYDASGNMTSSTDATGATTGYTYNSFGQVTGITDPQGGSTTYAYDGKGNMTSLTDPAGATTTYAYDTKGNVTKVTDAAGQSTSFTYTGSGNLASVTGPDGATTRYSYDAAGNVTSITDAKGGITRLSYDSRGRLIKNVNPQGNATTYTYDKNGNRLSETDANGNTTRYEYNSRNQLIKTIDALGSFTTYTYGSGACSSCGGSGGVDKLGSVTDANNNVTRYDYDSLGRLVKETDPLGTITGYQYDAKGNLITKTDAKGQTISYNYDANGRLLKKSYPDNTEETFTYDQKGNILTAANKNISYTFTYDNAGRMLTSSDNGGNTISYTYDTAGRKTRTVYPDTTTLAYGYDSAGRLASIKDQNNSFNLSYTPLGQRAKLSYPNGVTTGYSYDSTGNLTGIIHKTSRGKTIASYSYTLDKVGNRLTKTEPDTKTTYGYDAVYRLILAQLNRRATEQYSYDPVGNRLTGPERGTDYSYGPGNQLLKKEHIGFIFDTNGNLIAKGEHIRNNHHDHKGNHWGHHRDHDRHDKRDDRHHGKGWVYTYDFENRLIKAEKKQGNESTIVTFSYDPFGRRIEKRVEKNNRHGHDNHGHGHGHGHDDDGVITRYVYDGQSIIQETSGQDKRRSKEETVTYIHGPNIDEPLSIETDKKTHYYHADGLGSITALTDKQSNVVQSYDYDSFGNLEQHGEHIRQPFTYTGREWDKETGLYYYRARYYDPKVGRFIQKDPIGFAGGDVNLYGYVQNNPANYTDPFGESFKENYCIRYSGVIGMCADVGSIGAVLSGAGAPVGFFFSGVSVVNTMATWWYCRPISTLGKVNTATTLAAAAAFKPTLTYKLLNIWLTNIDFGLSLAGTDLK